MWIYEIIGCWGAEGVGRKNSSHRCEGRQKLVHVSFQRSSPSSLAEELNRNRNTESQNNLGWDGLLDVICSNPLLKAGPLNKLVRVLNSQILYVSKDGEFTTFLGSCSTVSPLCQELFPYIFWDFSSLPTVSTAVDTFSVCRRTMWPSLQPPEGS